MNPLRFPLIPSLSPAGEGGRGKDLTISETFAVSAVIILPQLCRAVLKRSRTCDGNNASFRGDWLKLFPLKWAMG